jgi:hypothetical protein
MTTPPADQPDEASAVDPGAIDLDEVRGCCSDIPRLKAAVEALRERIPKGDGLPCVCRFGGQTTDGRFDADMPIQECDLHKALRERVVELEETIRALGKEEE